MKKIKYVDDAGFTFIDHLISWSVNDILDDNFFNDKVRKIPCLFRSTTEYFDAFVYPLLEEARAELCSNLSMLSRAPFGRVVSCCKATKDTKLHFLYNVKVHHWRVNSAGGDSKTYNVLPGDVFVLMDSEFDAEEPVLQSGRKCVLASVVNMSQDDADEDTSATCIRVIVSKEIDMNDFVNKYLLIVFLTNVIPFERIWNALHMKENLKLLEKVLHCDSLDHPRKKGLCTLVDLENDWTDKGTDGNGCSETDHFWLNKLGSGLPRLNPSQKDAISASLKNIQCKDKFSVELVWGPPGTGKSKMISTLLCILLRLNCRGLACATTNVAITALASQVVELLRACSARNSDNRFCSLGSLLLFGSKKQVDVGSDIEDIYLDYRVKKLAEVFSPISGWRCSFSLLLNEFQDFSSQDHFLTGQHGQNRCLGNSEQLLSFLNSIRDQFNELIGPVKRCISIFCTHMAKSFIQEHNIENLTKLYDLLDSFESLLLQYIGQLSGLAPCSGVFQKSIVYILGLLEKKGDECFDLLQNLIVSLGKLKFPQVTNYDFISDFCFQMSSLLFCTASSSYKLYYAPIKSLDVVVIDEAAQLKECESIIPLQLPDLRHAILAGDEYQLQAMVKSHISASVDFGRSLFQRLGLLGWSKHLLNMQYRMHPSISAFPRRMFYSNKITDAPSVKSDGYEKRYLEGLFFGPYSFINITEGKEEFDDNGQSRKNMVEAAVVRAIVLRLYKGWCKSPCNKKVSIGVISPYSAQVKAIERMIGQRFSNLENFTVNIKSIDAFQGAEEDIILLSLVRSNNFGEIGFLSNPQRLNVALTRARHCLWVLGNGKTLAKANLIWRDFITDAKERKCFFNANEDEKISETIIYVKKELDQLDDLLSGNSVLFRNARWKVLFASNFIKSFSKLQSSQTKMHVFNLIGKLSNGWRPRKIKVDPPCESSVRIVKQFKVQGLYVICSNDIVKESEYFQVMRVWDILPLEAVAELVKRIDKHYGLFTEEFVRCCKKKCIEGTLEVPVCWSSNSNIVRYKSCSDAERTSISDDDDVAPRCIDKAEVEESLLLVKFYSLSVGVVKHLISVSDGRALELPMEVTDNEWEIIHYPRSSFVLGRSGTGKTLVLVTKLFQKEQLYHMALGGSDEVHGDASLCDDPSIKLEGRSAILRQLFVTVNPNLCHTVKQHISNLQSTVRGEILNKETCIQVYDETQLFEDIPHSFWEIPAESYPLVISLKKFLLMLDGTIGTSYFHRFVKTRQTCSLKSVELQMMERKEVSFDKFSVSYWPHFNSTLTKDLDPSRVFTEILSCIKGGIKVEQGRLTLDSYIQLSDCKKSSLSRNEREAIYGIFLCYEKMKLTRGEYDLSDVVNDLHHRFSHQRYEGDALDFVYIDEVQDWTVRQLSLLKYVCKNVKEGYVFAGDTAQTIAQGVDFSFDEIRSFFYVNFLQGPCVKTSKQDQGNICPIFVLNQNFRSHAGILKLAHSVIKLIYHFFPYSIDKVNPEFSLIDGDAPILLESASGDEDVVMKIFQDNKNDGRNTVIFGAEQVIIVRDESVRNEMPSHVKGHALVLTVFECKGLEFKDVLLYNFFSSSPIREHWSVIYKYMQEKNLGSSFPHFPKFNHAKHSGLCHELKQLYVAVTRAKERLWICESHGSHAEPMANYWKKLNLVRIRQFDNSLAQEIIFPSSKEEWKSQGFKFLEVSNYETAAVCFGRAGDTYWEKYARATGLKTTAAHMRGLSSEAVKMLTEAAEIFQSLDNNKEAAKCFYDAGNYERAGDIYLQHFQSSELEKACHCYTLAGFHARAAEIYAENYLYRECLHACNTGKLFNLGLQYVQSWKQLALEEGSIDLITFEQEFLKSCAHASYKKKDKKKMMKYVKKFSSLDSMRTFLWNQGCYEEGIDIEIEMGDIQEGLRIARKVGLFLREADLLEKAQNYEDASRLYIWYVFGKCCWASGGKNWLERDLLLKEELLSRAEASALNASADFHKQIHTEVLLLSTQSTGLSELEKQLEVSQKSGNLKWEVICTRKILEILLQTQTSPFKWESDSREMISGGQVSVEKLIYFWSSWKEKILTTLEHLKSLPAHDNHWDFCLHYFGVRKHPNTGYFMLYPDAEWVSKYPKKNNQRIGTEHLVTSIRHYWCSELLSVGCNMLEYLNIFQKFSADSMPMICKSRIVDHIFECTLFLMESDYLRQWGQVSTARMYYATKWYAAAVFTTEWGRKRIMDLESGKIEKKLEEVDDDGHNTRNLVEVAVLMNIVQRLHKEWQCYSQKISVCIVSQGVAQVKDIERRIGKRYEKLLNFELKVKLVEGFQEGGEADIVIVSTVRSNSAGSSEFRLDHGMADVASSRARHCLWILGNKETLAEADTFWKDIISDAKLHSCYFNAEEDENLAKVIVDVKSKLDELEDLLDKDNNIFKASGWKVVFSENFVKSFAKLPSIYSKKLVVNFILKLANGWRPKK
uniref:UvrD-like helicase ATP-binding domain-containing protein n=1 Tax=Chenopodium quinoa TaxID=63459 RepID=A0A803NBG7_CHEQI